MKVIDRFLAWELIRNFVVVLSIVACLLFIGLVIDNLGKMLENDTAWADAFLFFAASLPQRLLEVIPMAALVAVLFTAGGMARNNEILAMLTGGVSIYRIALPFAIVGLLISIGSIALGEKYAPQATRLANRLERVHIDGKLPRNRNSDIVASGLGGNNFAITNYRYDNRGEVMQQVTIWEMDPDNWKMKYRLDAQRGVFQGTTQYGDTIWEFERVTEASFDHRGNVSEVIVHEPDKIVPKTFSPNLNIYLRDLQKPEEMNYVALKDYIETMKQRGADTSRLESDLHFKLAYPFSSLILIIAGIYCGMRAQKGSLVVGFGIGLVLGLVYFLTTATAKALGQAGVHLPPMLFAWGPTGAFALISLYLLIKSGRAR
jgi:lipopolysaccharide export system permease protein